MKIPSLKIVLPVIIGIISPLIAVSVANDETITDGWLANAGSDLYLSAPRPEHLGPGIATSTELEAIRAAAEAPNIRERGLQHPRN